MVFKSTAEALTNYYCLQNALFFFIFLLSKTLTKWYLNFMFFNSIPYYLFEIESTLCRFIFIKG